MDIIVKRTPPELSQLPWWDNTRLVGVNTCPTDAALRYGLHKTMREIGPGSRALALEVGTICHQVFAMVRLVDLLEHGERWYSALPQYTYAEAAVLRHFFKLFGETDMKSLLNLYHSADDLRTRMVQMALYLIEASGYYDDPTDRRRTVTNMEEACVAYIDRYPLNQNLPVVHHDFVGVELPVDVCISLDGGAVWHRFVGRVDAVQWDTRGKFVEVVDNKTGSRLDNAWLAGYTMSHQVTGYCIAVTAILSDLGIYSQPIEHGVVLGLAMPQPRTSDFGGYVRHPVTRPEYRWMQWFEWFAHTIEIGSKWMRNPIQAPKYTHSCNRYFRSCQFVPFCDSDAEEQRAMVLEMPTHEWSPLDEGTD